MSFASMYRRKITTLQSDIARLQNQLGREAKKGADLARRINSATKSLQQTKSGSTAKSKIREIERHQSSLAQVEKKRADLEAKIAAKTEGLNQAKEKLTKEEQKDAKKARDEAEKTRREHERKFSDIDRTVDNHGRQIRETAEMVMQLKQPVDEIVVLFLAANPLDQEALQLDEEIRAIDEMIRKSEHRDAVKLESKWAVRPADVLQALNQYSPHVVHFSGHGSDREEIIFQNDSGETKPIAKEAVVQLMAASSGNIRLIFFNTCYSRAQAEAVVEHVEATIGMKSSIGDRAARVFASQFYSAIGFGKSIRTAFEQAKALLMMENIPEEDTPELFTAPGINAEEVVLVKPPP